jgi:hypothetical protein
MYLVRLEWCDWDVHMQRDALAHLTWFSMQILSWLTFRKPTTFTAVGRWSVYNFARSYGSRVAPKMSRSKSHFKWGTGNGERREPRG